MKKRLFVDMDGTVARFYEDNLCLEKMYEAEFFSKLMPYQSMVEAVKRLIADYADKVEVTILSAVPVAAGSAAEKRAECEKRNWVRDNIGYVFELYCKVGESKADIVKQSLGRISGRDFLLDDYSGNLFAWQNAGGYPIKFRNELNGKGTNGYNFTGDCVYYTQTADEIVSSLLKIMGIEETH